MSYPHENSWTFRFLYRFLDNHKPAVESKHIIGTQAESDIKSALYSIKFRDDHWAVRGFDPIMRVFTLCPIDPHELAFFQGEYQLGRSEPATIRCDCGSDAVKHPRHSTWCTMSTKNAWEY